jgi:aspartate racemase
MSWQSSAEYYRLINVLVQEQLGGQANAKSMMWTANFAEIERAQHNQDWILLSEAMANASRYLEAGGADCIVLCTNTMHKVADAIESAVSIPFVCIIDATARAIETSGLEKIGLLGTSFTMEDGFYQRRWNEICKVEVITPGSADRRFVHRAIYEELCKGTVKDQTRAEFIKIVDRLVNDGAQGVILGCTELGLLLRPSDLNVPLFDSTLIHARAAVDYALQENR